MVEGCSTGPGTTQSATWPNPTSVRSAQVCHTNWPVLGSPSPLRTKQLNLLCTTSFRESTANTCARERDVSAVLVPLRPLLLPRVQRPARLLLARVAPLLSVDPGRSGIFAQQGGGGVRQEPQLHQISQHLDRPHQGQQL